MTKTVTTTRVSGLVAVAALLTALVGWLTLAGDTLAQAPPSSSVRPPAGATTTPQPTPGADQPQPGDAEFWRQVRRGVEGQVTIPDRKAGQLVQPEGEAWRNFRNGPLSTWGAYALGGVVALLAVFMLVRGRIRIDAGWAGRTVTRFTNVERMGHWLLAVSFVLLAVSGLNMLYGRSLLMPLIGKELFATITNLGKLGHTYVAFAFMAGLVMVLAMWLPRNLPHWRDVVWLLKAGGLFKKGSHPAAGKFNAGQKLLFWLVILGGVVMSATGLSLLLPFQIPLFAKTFAALNSLGLALPIGLSEVQEAQYAASVHAVTALLLTAVIIGHVYIGTIGMQGAFSAMGSGEVDVNWAKEHHSIWAADELKRLGVAPDGGAKPHPAE